MRYALLAGRCPASPIHLPIECARHHGGVQHTSINQQTPVCGDEMGAILAPIPDRCDLDAESIREGERQRIARDIHDELGQQILVLRMDVVKLCGSVSETHPQLHAVTDIVLQQLESTMHSLRTVIRGLRPAVLDLGLRAAIQLQCTDFIQRFGVACELEWNAGDIAITDHCATALFRTLQESMTNVQRHARASRVCISVNTDNDHILMTVSDNGIGSVPADLVKINSFGLLGMQERVKALGGTLAIANAEHEGMTVTVSLPI